MVHSCADFVNLPLVLVTVFLFFYSQCGSALGNHEMGCMYVHILIIIMHNYYYMGVGWGVEGSMLEAWMKSHKSEVAII